jgi:D-alanine-D-alanine ligase
MRVLVLHSDVAADAPADEQDTLFQAQAIADALAASGHEVRKAGYVDDQAALGAVVRARATDAVFNVVEAIDGSGRLAARVPQILDALGVPFTGAGTSELAATSDKPLSKRMMRDAGLPTPDWAEPPDWAGLVEAEHYIVKHALEDASIGLDDASVVGGCAQVRARAEESAKRHGGRWFAEAFIDGREFNVAVMEKDGGPFVLPLAEMTFADWPCNRPKIVGYAAKWDSGSFEEVKTVRVFGLEEREPALAASLRNLARRTWDLFDLSGYARIDFRVDRNGNPLILEINPNPCLSPDAGFAAAAEEAGYSYNALVEHILVTAFRSR